MTLTTEPHRPDVVLWRDEAGRWHVRCNTCSEAARPTTHKPLAEQWRDQHNRSSTSVSTRRTP